MKKTYLIFLILNFIFTETFLGVTPPSTQGSEFYFSFTRALPGRAKDMVLLVSSERAGVVKFTDAAGVTTTKNFNAGTTSISLAHIADADSKENEVGGETSTIVTGDLKYCYTIATNSVQNEGYMVESFESNGTTPQKVSLYAGLSGSKTMDVANVYPIDALGNEYYVLSHPGYTKDGYAGPSEAVVVATADNTTIEIIPTCLLDNQSATDDIKKIITVTLNKGQTYQIRALSPKASDIGQSDITGTLIRTKDDGGANKCKRIAVFSGTQHGYPGDFEYDENSPTHLWGTEYLIDAPQDGGVNVNRIVASKPCTHVNINGTLVATLNQTEYYDYIDLSSTGCYVQTDKPVGVAMFTHPYEGQDSKHSNDASMTILAPIEQNLDSIIFTATYNADANTHKVSIVTPTADVNSLFLYQLTGSTWTPVTLSGWTPITAKPDYSSIVYDLSTTTSYKIISKKGGFNAYVYGYGSSTDEYGYSAGSAARSAKTTFYLNGDPTLNSNDLSGICVDKPVTLDANVSYSFSSIIWDYGDGTKRDTTDYPTSQTTHTYASKGTYPITMIVIKTFSDCYGSVGLQDTAKADLTIIDKISSSRSETICKGSSIMSSRTNEAAFGGVTPKYYWSTGATTESITTNDDYGTANKLYWVKTYDTNCHLYIDTILVNVRPIAQSSRSENHCNNLSNKSSNETIGFTSATPNVNGTLTYLWNTGETTQTIPVTDGFGLTTKHWVEATAGCKYVDTITVTVPAKITNSLSSSSGRVCGDGKTEVTITATVNGPATSNTWEMSENGAAFITFTPSVNSLQHKYAATENTTFKYTSEGVCETSAKTVIVYANTPFNATLVATSSDFIGGYTLPLSGGNVKLDVQTDVPNTYGYTWTPNVSTTSSFSKSITEDETYQVLVSDLDGKCTSLTNVVDIKLDSVTINTIIYPGGSQNQSIAENLMSTFIYGYKTIIYNRYGQLISEKENAGWDGKYKGNVADAGVYFYVVEYKTSNGGTKAIKGSVEVVK